jgi:hypothetical protein
MPYIKADKRWDIQSGAVLPTIAGELNYKITQVLLDYVKSKGASYQTFNDILGALEGAKQEFYRRVVSKYEDQKISENGDVY